MRWAEPRYLHWSPYFRWQYDLGVPYGVYLTDGGRGITMEVCEVDKEYEPERDNGVSLETQTKRRATFVDTDLLRDWEAYWVTAGRLPLSTRYLLAGQIMQRALVHLQLANR